VLEGRELGERIRAGFEQMKGNENALLATRSHDTAVSANLTIFMVISGSLLSIALLLLVYRKLRKEMTRRVEAQQRAQAYSDEIEDLYNNAPAAITPSTRPTSASSRSTIPSSSGWATRANR
jgi:hypothetical protein